MNTIENFVNTFDINRMMPGRMHAELSTHYFAMAREAILKVLVEGEQEAVLGYSTGGRRMHTLYRSSNGTIYVVHMYQGEYNDAYYFHPGIMGMYFMDHENEIPQWELSDDLKKMISNHSNRSDIVYI